MADEGSVLAVRAFMIEEGCGVERRIRFSRPHSVAERYRHDRRPGSEHATRWAPGLLLAVSIASACTTDQAPVVQPLVRDSLGIAITENPDSRVPDGLGWRVDSVPVLTIGEFENASEAYLFDRIRGALRLAGDTILVVDGGSLELRFFDSGGKHIRSVGGGGEGPGEFQAVRVGRYGSDSLVAWDEAQRRFTIMGRDGTFGRDRTLADLNDSPTTRGFFVDGSLLATSRSGVNAFSAPAGPHPEEVLAYRLSTNGQIDTVGIFPNGQILVIRAADVASMSNIPFGPQAMWAVAGDHFLFGFPERYEIRSYRPDGNLLRILRLARTGRPLTDAIRNRDREERLRGRTDPRQIRHFEVLYDESPVPETLPAFGQLLVDTKGNVWVEHHRLSWEEQPQWTVFDPEGRLLGTVRTPAGLAILEIGSDYLLGNARDELGVERIVVHGLAKRQE